MNESSVVNGHQEVDGDGASSKHLFFLLLLLCSLDATFPTVSHNL